MSKVPTRSPQVHLMDDEGPLLALLDLGTELCPAGFRPGIPPALLPKTIAIDAHCCARMICGRCGNHGLRYQPYSRKHGNSSGFDYRVLGQCPKCSAVEEC